MATYMTYSQKLEHYPELAEYFKCISFGGGFTVPYTEWRIRWYRHPYLIYTIPGYNQYDVLKQKNVWKKPVHVVLFVQQLTDHTLQFKTYKQVHDQNVIFADEKKYRLPFYLDLIAKHRQVHQHGTSFHHLR